MMSERIGIRRRAAAWTVIGWSLVSNAMSASADGPLAGEEVAIRQQTDAVISGLTGRMRAFGEWIDGCGASIGGGGLADPWIGSINGARLLTSVLVLLLASGAAWALVHGIRRFAGRLRKHGDMTWPRMFLSAVRKPLAFAFVLVATYFSVGILLDATGTKGPRFLSGCVYVGLAVAAFWLLERSVLLFQALS